MREEFSRERRVRRSYSTSEIERERKYVVSGRHASEFLHSLSGAPQLSNRKGSVAKGCSGAPQLSNELQREAIVQSYFPKQYGEFLIPLAIELRLLHPKFRRLQVTQARLRHLTKNTEESYFLTVKGRLPDLLPTERIELPLALSEETYRALLPQATAGTITKDRYVAQVNGPEDALSLEIDIPHSRFVSDGEVEDLRTLDLAFLEVELATRTLDDVMRAGLHEIDLLRRAIDISKDNPDHAHFRKPLSWSRLARKGLRDPKLQRILPELTRKVLSQ
ncbi:hypothetical protein MRY87_00355 [bacterium]|nr:hypothetical protein [bacterium]